jgi:hypothetical protein
MQATGKIGKAQKNKMAELASTKKIYSHDSYIQKKHDRKYAM